MKQNILIVMCCVCLLACRQTREVSEQLQTVKVGKVQRMDISQTHEYPFISMPVRTTELSFRVGGQVMKFDALDGQYYAKGEQIAVIDNRDYKLKKQRAEASFRQAEADYLRTSRLYENNNISGMTYEQSKANYERTKADYEQAKNDLSDTRLVAPFNGYIQQTHIEHFQDVKPSQPIVTLIDIDEIKIQASVTEEVASLLRGREKEACTIRFHALEGKTYKPEKAWITQSVTENKLSYMLTAIIDNADRTLMGGMAGNLMVDAESRKISEGKMAVPVKAVAREIEQRSYVWAVDGDNTVRKKYVELGRLLTDGMVEVKSGLSGDERIVLTGLTALSDNEKVQILD